MTSLPLELGFIKTLNALHWIGNAIEFPNKEILELTNDDMKKQLRKLKRQQDKLNEETIAQNK